MRLNPNRQLKRSLLVLSMTVALAATAQAQGGYDQGRYDRRSNSNVGGSIQITFGSQPRWVAVPGTRVREVRRPVDAWVWRADTAFAPPTR